MGTIFKGSEILDMAVRIEQNGIRFYSALVEKAESDKTREIFQYLADQEKQHEVTFKKMLDEIGAYQPAPVLEEDYEQYMQALAESHVFTSDEALKRMAELAGDIGEALQIGIGFEKDSILLFMEMRNFIPESQQKVIERLISEEKKHLIQLQEMKKSGAK